MELFANILSLCEYLIRIKIEHIYYKMNYQLLFIWSEAAKSILQIEKKLLILVLYTLRAMIIILNNDWSIVNDFKNRAIEKQNHRKKFCLCIKRAIIALHSLKIYPNQLWVHTHSNKRVLLVIQMNFHFFVLFNWL